MNKKLIIFAGRSRIADEFAREKGLFRSRYTYVYMPDQLRGLRGNEYVLAYNWIDNPHAHMMQEICRISQMTEKTDNDFSKYL